MLSTFFEYGKFLLVYNTWPIPQSLKFLRLLKSHFYSNVLNGKQVDFLKVHFRGSPVRRTLSLVGRSFGARIRRLEVSLVNKNK